MHLAKGKVILGGEDVVSAGGFDALVAKFDSSGGHLWQRAFGGPGSQFVSEIAVDPGGDVVLAGHFENALDIGGGSFPSGGSFDVFVAKLAP